MATWIKWLKSLFGAEGKSKEPIFVCEQIAVNQSIEFTSHNLLVEKFFSFLEHNHDFPPPTSEWVSREYCTVYQNSDVEILIIFETSTIPHVNICKGTKGTPGYVSHAIVALDCEKQLQQLFTERFSRFEPKSKRYLDKVIKENMYDRREIADDYTQWGKAEHEKVLSLYANLIKNNPDILTGDFSVFPDYTVE